MAITLAEANVNKNEKIVEHIIDETRRQSILLDLLTFDDTVTAGTGGSTLTYGYTMLETPSTASFRAINGDYTNNEAKRKRKTAELAIMGGNFKIDRVIIKASTNAINELEFQIQQKIKALVNKFHNSAINGDVAVETNSFDGLDKLLTGTDTEINATTVLTTIDQTTAFKFIEELNNMISKMSNKPTVLMGNSRLINKIKTVAMVAGYKTAAEDAFGRTIDAYDGIPLIDLGRYYNGTSLVDVVPVTAGKSDLYAAWLDVNEGFHGISLAGGAPIDSFLPPLKQVVEAQYEGSVELVAGVALKSTKAAAVLRGITL